jgi:hypothetical protein
MLLQGSSRSTNLVALVAICSFGMHGSQLSWPCAEPLAWVAKSGSDRNGATSRGREGSSDTDVSISVPARSSKVAAILGPFRPGCGKMLQRLKVKSKVKGGTEPAKS